MKQILTLLAFSLAIYTIKAQTWVDLGIKGGAGANFLMNQNIWSDVDYNHSFTTGYSFGGKIGFNFNQEHEITFDALFGTFNQDFTYNITDTISESTTEYTSSIGFKRTDLSLMYRHNKNGSYLEFGPCIALLKSPYREDSRTMNLEFNDNHFNLMNKGLILGFGNYIMGTESFGITAGMRITQYFDDFISSKGQTVFLPTLTQYETYKASRPLFIELIFEANFDFAYVAKAKCGRKKLMFF